MTLSPDQQQRISTILQTQKNLKGALLPILHEIQAQLDYVPADAVSLIAEALNLSRAEVHGVISFYHFFKTTQPGKHTLQVCRAESCQAVGGRELEAYAKERLEIEYHQTTKDNIVSLEPVYCLGNCACSPSVRVGDEVHGLMTPAKLDALIEALSTDVLELS